MAKTTEKPISKNSPETIANEIPMRIDWSEASKNHPILSSIAISGAHIWLVKRFLMVSLQL